MVTSGATDHKAHGSDHAMDFELRIGSAKKKLCKLLALLLKSVIKQEQLHKLQA